MARPPPLSGGMLGRAGTARRRRRRCRQDRHDRAADRGSASRCRMSRERIDFISGKLLGIRYQGRHPDRQPEAPGEIRRPRRCVRLRDVLRGGAGGGDRARSRRVRDRRFAASATTTARSDTTSATIISPTGASATSRTASAGRSRSSRRSRIDKTADVAPRVRQASGVDHGDRQGDHARQAAKLLAPGDIIGFASRRAGPRLLPHRADRLRPRTANCCCAIAALSQGRVAGPEDDGVRRRQSGEIRDVAARGRATRRWWSAVEEAESPPRRKPAGHRSPRWSAPSRRG